MTTIDTPPEQPVAPLSPEAEARVEAFRQQLRSLRAPGSGRAGSIMLIVGIVGMALGLVLGVSAYFLSHGTTSSLEQGDATVLGILAGVITVIGAAAFVRTSIERVLRFWVARITFEQAVQTDRLIEQNERLIEALRARG